MSGKVVDMRCARPCRVGVVLAAKKRLEAQGTEDMAVYSCPLPLQPQWTRTFWFPFACYLGRTRPVAHRWGWFSSEPRPGGSLWSVVQVEDGRGKARQVVLAGAELLRFPAVGEGLGIRFGVAEHLPQVGVIESAVEGVVRCDLSRGGG